MYRDIIERKLNTIRGYFDVDQIIKSEINSEEIIKYYLESESGYRKVHSRNGAIHMAINYGNRFSSKGYDEQQKIIDQYIGSRNNLNILELGCGKGYSLEKIAIANPTCQIDGIDFCSNHVEEAKRRTKGLKNVTVKKGDYLLYDYGERKYDLIFAIETLNHISDNDTINNKVYSNLNEGGLFIIFDGYKSIYFEHYDEAIKNACELVEKALNVKNNTKLDKYIEGVTNTGFLIERADDMSFFIAPNLKRFKNIAKVIFGIPPLFNYLKGKCSNKLLNNLIASFLMYYTVKSGAHKYYLIVGRKN